MQFILHSVQVHAAASTSMQSSVGMHAVPVSCLSNQVASFNTARNAAARKYLGNMMAMFAVQLTKLPFKTTSELVSKMQKNNFKVIFQNTTNVRIGLIQVSMSGESEIVSAL